MPVILLSILKDPDPMLRRVTSEAEEARFGGAELLALVQSMKKTMKEAEGIGLAANQVGENLQVFVAEVENKFYIVINPKIIKVSAKKISMEEGCLSVPNIFGLVERSERIEIEGRNQFGKKIRVKTGGILARVIQHEIDHLNGVLFIDKATQLIKVEETKNVKI